ncbi:cation transporter [Patescibacteria group bacterium]|nr:cation transporter [Patescibacteria group bacterium]MBU1472957.1 cation transporter [Patescibacteria group bacterium]MBU2459695.1 cation transporter [Patescibacteria group bacterium]MBU2544576.1 cation transporter [Patescibacteria group bacterium]
MKKIYKIKGMHCTSCAMLIEGAIEDIGVAARASFTKGELEVEYDPKKVSGSAIKEAVEKAGYSID